MTEAEDTKRARYKLLTSMFATYGYGLLGASTIQPLLSRNDIHWSLAAGIAAGLAFQAAALYIVPRGEHI